MRQIKEVVEDDYFKLDDVPRRILIISEDPLEYSATLTDEDAKVMVSCKEEFKDRLEEITIPGSIEIEGKEWPVESLSFFAFRNCPNLKSVKILEGVERILIGAFADCPRLEEIQVPKSLKYVGFGAFSGCGRLNPIPLPTSTEINGN